MRAGCAGSAGVEFVFVVKVSKFCNLRCAYCYEHRELHVRDRMQLQTLRALIAGVDAFGDYLSELGIRPEFSFVWHGGEPLLLPPEYYREIAAMQRESVRRYPYRNSVQTNLFGIDRQSLAHVLEQGWELGVSIDFADGVRCNAGGRDSNQRVTAAAEALHKSGGRFGVISVLGAHNRDALSGAYDWVAEFAEGWRILPVFEGGPDEAIAALKLPEQEVAAVFAELFNRRAAAARHVGIEPLDTYAKAAILRILDRPVDSAPMRPLLDNIYVVNVDGGVFTRPFAYDPARCLGNVNAQAFPSMLTAEAYRLCQQQILRRKIQHCPSCEYCGFCDSMPMHEHGAISVNGAGESQCGFPRHVMAAIERELAEAEVDAATIGAWALEWLSGQGALPAPPG